MMPERFMKIFALLEMMAMSVLSFVLFLTFENVLSFLGFVATMLYALPRIKREHVDKNYDGDWILWLKGIPNFFKKVKKDKDE